MKSAVKAERERRVLAQDRGEPVNMNVVGEIIAAGVRTLSKKYHPDTIVGSPYDQVLQSYIQALSAGCT